MDKLNLYGVLLFFVPVLYRGGEKAEHSKTTTMYVGCPGMFKKETIKAQKRGFLWRWWMQRHYFFIVSFIVKNQQQQQQNLAVAWCLYKMCDPGFTPTNRSARRTTVSNWQLGLEEKAEGRSENSDRSLKVHWKYLIACFSLAHTHPYYQPLCVCAPEHVVRSACERTRAVRHCCGITGT